MKSNKADKRKTIPTNSNAKKNSPTYKAQKPSNSSFKMPAYLPILGILGITFLVFFPTFENEFVNWDDEDNIVKNTALHNFDIVKIFTQNVIGNYNPLPILTFAIEEAIFGFDNLPLVIHVNNLLLHLGCVFFVYRIGQEIGLKGWALIVLTLLFGIHPMRVESVAWATERKDVLYGIFFLSAFLQYVKYLKSEDYTFKNKHFIYAFVLFAIGAFAKVQMVSLPLSMLALDYYFRRPIKWNLIFEKIPFWVGSLAIGLLNVFFLISNKSIGQTNKLTYTFIEKLCIGAYSYCVYLGKCIFPWEMSPLYPYESQLPITFYIAPIGFLASLPVLYWAYKKDWRPFIFGWAFFFVNFIFLSQIVTAGQGLIADRFTYISYFGFFFIIAYYTQNYLSKTWAKAALAAYFIIFAVMSFNQVKVWKNGGTLWSQAIKYHPEASTPWGNRATYYREHNQPELAMTDYNKALSIEPNAGLHNSRGKLYFDKGQFNEALSDYTTAIKLDPKLAEPYSNRAAIYGTWNRLDSTIADINMALELDSTNINALVNRGTAYSSMKKYDLALQDLNKVIAAQPKHQNAYINRFVVYKETNQLENALADNGKYLELNPNNMVMWYDRVKILRDLGRPQEGLVEVEKAMKLASNDGYLFLERARCHRALGNQAAKLNDAKTAISLGRQPEAELLQ